MLDSRAEKRLGHALSCQCRHPSHWSACSAAWLFSAPAEVESPNDGPRRTRLLAPSDPLEHDLYWLASNLNLSSEIQVLHTRLGPIVANFRALLFVVKEFVANGDLLCWICI